MQLQRLHLEFNLAQIKHRLDHKSDAFQILKSVLEKSKILPKSISVGQLQLEVWVELANLQFGEGQMEEARKSKENAVKVYEGDERLRIPHNKELIDKLEM